MAGSVSVKTVVERKQSTDGTVFQTPTCSGRMCVYIVRLLMLV